MSSILPPSSQTERAQRAIARATRDRRAQVGAGAAAAAGAVAVAARAISQARDGDGPSRAYRLRPGKRPAKEAIRAAYGRIEDAMEQLADHDREPASAVHEARKDLKKLRSLLRLARPALGSELYRRENERFRDLGRALSETRDAEVKLQTLAGLRDAGFAPGGVEAYARELAEDVKGRDDTLPIETRLAVLAAIRERQRELLEQALPLGEALYEEKPKAFTKRLDAYWSASAG